MKLIIIVLIALLLPTTFNAQTIIKCNDNYTTFWVITNDNIDYALKLYGDIAKSKKEDLLNVEDKALQYIIIDKTKYLEKNDNDDISILVRYVSGEAEYLSAKFSDAFEIQTQI